MTAFWILIVTLTLASAVGAAIWLLYRDTPERRATITQTLVLAPERDEATRVARALRWRLRRLWLQSRLIRSIQVEVRTKNGLSATIVQMLAETLDDPKAALTIQTDEELTLKERLDKSKPSPASAPEAAVGLSPEETLAQIARDQEASAPRRSRRTVVRNGRVLESASSIHVRNHSQIPARLAMKVPRVLRRFRSPVTCLMTIEY